MSDTVTARLRALAAERPDRTAVDDGARRLSYAALVRRMDGVAWSVAEAGQAGRPVALVLRQGVPAVTAMLGVLAAGGAWVPLDADDPPARRAELCDRVGAGLVLTDREGARAAAALASPGRRVLAVDDPAREEGGGPPCDAGPATPACIHFTSGSTGRPKGVVDTHAGLLDNARRYTQTLGLGPDDRLTAVQPPAFSGVVSSILGALLNGGVLLPMRAGGGRLDALAAALRAGRPTVWHSVPSILRSLGAVDPGPCEGVRVVRLEGDRATGGDVALARRLFPGATVANGLGTTETGLCRQLRLGPSDPAPGGALPVGYAVPGLDVLVAGEDGAPLPPGTAGEIVVRGRHLALGYWDEPELTAAAFRPDPADPGVRRYRTGDLGVMREDGCLLYLGRRDGGLKVRGVRVEPAEVEAALLALPGVAEAVVTTRAGRRGEGVLDARVVLAPGGPRPEALRAALAERLPAAMVPSAIEAVGAVPLTGAGKIDRAMRAPRPPRDALEARLLALWEEVLERDGFGVDDSFTALGGDSLAAAELLAALEADAGRPLPASLLVRASTVAELAGELRGHGATPPAPGVAVLRAGGAGAPVVLVHGSHFGLDRYAALVRGLPAGPPVWGLDLPPGRLPPLADLAARHAAALRAAGPARPPLVAGFCSAAILAAEVARALRAGGEDAGLAMIGVDAADFPALVAPDALARHRASRRPAARVRRHLAGGRGARHHAEAARRLAADLAARPRRRAAFGGGRVVAPVPGRALLVLSDEATARWTADPAADWAGVATAVEVAVLRAGNDDLLRPPAAARVAALLGAAGAPPRTSVTGDGEVRGGSL